MKYIHVAIVILSVSSHYHCEEAFAMIYSSGRRIMLEESNKLNKAKSLTEYQCRVTSLAVHENYLLVSLDCHLHQPSAIHRCEIIHSPAGRIRGINKDSCVLFERVKLFKTITCIAISKNGTVWAGRNDGVLRRCSVYEPGSCRTFKHFNSSVTGLDYKACNDHFYVTLANGLLIDCIMRLSSCKTVADLGSRVTAVKFAFGAVWVGVGCDLKKCFVHNFFVRNDVCDDFDRYEKCGANVKFIGATRNYLYVSFEGTDNVWRCDPERSRSCSYVYPMPSNMGAFVIINEDI